MKHTQRTTKLCSVLFASIALFALVAGPAAAAEKITPAKKSASGFSFAVYGDSRSMMYLPYMDTKQEEETKEIVDISKCVSPENIATKIIKKNVKLTYKTKK